MAKEDFLVKCCPCFVVVKRLNAADIIKWKNKKKPVDKRRTNRWKRGNYSRRKKKNFIARETSDSRSTFDGDSQRTNKSNVIDNDDTIISTLENSNNVETNETRDSRIMEKNNETFPLRKYKKKRFRSLSPLINDEFVTERVPVDIINTTNFMNKKLKITLERLPVNDGSIVQKVQFNNFDDSEIFETEEANSIIIDSCAETVCKRISPPIIESEQVAFNKRNAEIKSLNAGIKVESSSSDDEESELANNEDHLTDMCLMNEAIVLVTRLEDVMDALENNYTVPDIEYLSDKSLEIIHNVKYSWNMSDDTSYCLVMSPDTEESINPNDLTNEKLGDESDSDDSYVFNPRQLRPSINRRRISSEESSSSSDDDDGPFSSVASKIIDEMNSAKEISIPNKNNNTTCTNEEAERSALLTLLSCPVCKEIFKNKEKQLNHTCLQLEMTEKSSKKSPNESRKGKKQRINPKISNLECNICSQKCESHEQLSDHVFKHTPREHQDAYRDAQRQSCDIITHEVSIASMTFSESDESKKSSNIGGVAVMLDTKKKNKNGKSPKGKMTKTSMSVAICSCHTDELQPTDLTVQIEMVLYCEICKVLFRRSHCFETHYRKNSICNQNRRKGRLPRLFCSTCRVVLNTLCDMRKHLEKHASINRHGTVTFVCNICQVVFFGVGTVFCTHWFNHDKDPMFIASQHSFPRVCVSDRGRKPIGTLPGEQYLFVAEYVCRLCKQQFSSDSELSSHECKCEDPKQSIISASLPQNSLKDSSLTKTANTKKSAQANSSNNSNSNTPNSIKVSGDNPESLQINEERVALNSETVIQQENEKELSEIQNERQVNNKRPFLPRPPVKRPPVKKISIQDEISPIQNRNSSMNIWICDICNDSFPNLRALGDHAPIHFTDSNFNDNVNDPKKNYVCTICKHSCASLKLIGAHWGKHDLMRYTCSICNNTYFTLSTFSRHIIMLCGKHNPTCRVSYGVKETCKICQIVYKDENDLMTHNSLKHSTTSSNSKIENSKAVAISKKSLNLVVTPEKTKSPSVCTNGLEQAILRNNCINNDYSHEIPSALSQSIVTTKPPVNSTTIEQSSTIPLVLCVKPTNSIESTERPLNNSYFINIAIPNTAQTPGVNIDDNNAIKVASPQKVRALEDPMVQVVLTKPTLLDSTLSASLVTNPSSLETVENVASNKSTFTLMVSNTTVGGAAINSASIDDLNGNNSTNSNNDDIQVVEVSMDKTKETSVQSNLPIKLINCNSKKPVISSDTDIEILSEISKSNNEKILVSEGKTEIITDESSEASGPKTTTLVANPLSRPKGFLRVKNLAELRDNPTRCFEESGNDNNMNTLTQHLLASLETLKENPTEKYDTTDGKSALAPANSNGGYMPGKRTLPYIPQRIMGRDVRRANPLLSRPDSQNNISKPMNRVTPIPTSNNNNNNIIINTNSNVNTINQGVLQNPQSIRSTLYTCPMCPQYQYDSLDKFIGHLYLHPNMPPDVQELVRYLMNRTNSQRMYQESLQVSSKTSQSQSQLHLQVHQSQSQIYSQPNSSSTLVSQTDSAVNEFQKHSHQVVNAQNQNTTSVYQQITSFNSFQSGFNQIYEQQYPYQMQNIQQSQITTQQIQHSILPQAYCCNLCVNYQLPSYDEFQKHIQILHNITLNTSERNICTLCPQITMFPSEQCLKHHENIQHPFICEACLQRFSKACDLNTHCSLHHQTVPYSNNFYSNRMG